MNSNMLISIKYFWSIDLALLPKKPNKIKRPISAGTLPMSATNDPAKRKITAMSNLSNKFQANAPIPKQTAVRNQIRKINDDDNIFKSALNFKV